MKAFINPISSTYPPTIEIVEGVYGQRFEGTDENIKKLHFNQAIDEIDILTNQNNTPIRQHYEKLSPEKKDYAIKALARLYAYFVIINQTYVKGNLEASQGDTNINYQFNYPKNVDPQIYNLLQMAGLYQQNKTINLGNKDNLADYDNVYRDENSFAKAVAMQPITEFKASRSFLYQEKITSKDQSLNFHWTWDKITGSNVDISVNSIISHLQFGNSLKKINNKWEVVKLKSLDSGYWDYQTIKTVFNQTILGDHFISKSPNLEIKYIPIDDSHPFPLLEFTLKTHEEVFGDSLKKINNKWEVVKLKNETGDKSYNYQDFDIILGKFAGILLKMAFYDENWFKLDSVKFLITAFKNNTFNYFLHTDGEFSFHYWQNPSLIVTYKKPEAYVFTQLFGINQNPRITDWSPYIEYDFNANTGEVDVRLASFKKTGAGWDKKIYLVIKTEEGDTSFDFKKNPLTFVFKNKTYDIQSLLDKIHDRPEHKEIIFSKEVLNIPRKAAVENKHGKVVKENGKWIKKNGKVITKLNPRIVENGNVIEVHELNDVIDNNKWVGATFQFHFDYCAGKESTLHGNEYKYKVYRMVFIADKLPALNTSTWTKIYKMDYQVQWFLGNRGELKYEEFEDCSEGAPTVQLKLETIGYYLRFTFNGFKREWNDQTINFSQPSLWDRFKIIADVYK